MRENGKRQDYDSIAHSKTRLRYHVIFSTKYRRNCLEPVRDAVLAAFRYGESISDYKILVMNLESDHIHFLLKWKPSLSIEQVVRRMKQTSTVYLWQHHEQHFRRFYWRDRHIWTGGYFCATVGDVSEQNVNCCGAEDSAACPCTRPHVSTEVPRLWAC